MQRTCTKPREAPSELLIGSTLQLGRPMILLAQSHNFLRPYIEAR